MFSTNVTEMTGISVARRFYTKGRTPAITYEWMNLRLIQYMYNEVTGVLEFEEM